MRYLNDDLDSLHNWLTSAAEQGAIAIICGSNGDMDTIGSALSLASAFPQAMACGVGISKIAKRMIAQTEAPFLQLSDGAPMWPKKLVAVVCVDAAAPSQIGLTLPDVPFAIIDHHDTNSWEVGEKDLMIRGNVSATTQIIFAYLQKYHPRCLSTEVRKLLLAGLITDTGRFKHANAETFRCVGELLMGSEIDYPRFLETFESDRMTDSERGAMAAGMQRMESKNAGEWYLMHTRVGANEGRMCNVLLAAGAEVALASRSRDGITRLTARAPRVSTAGGVHLGKIMESIAEKIGGDGGGHDGAAGWSGHVDRITAESAFIHALSGAKKVR